MRQTSFEDFHCSLARSLEAIGDWWSPLILRDLAVGVRRFDELVEDLGISRNLLTSRLNTLVAHAIVERQPVAGHATRVEYVLTDAGHELVAVLMALTAWGDRWRTPTGGPPIEFHHHDHQCVPIVVCQQCVEPVDPRAITFKAGPGGRRAPGTALIGTRMQPPDRTSSSRRSGTKRYTNGGS
jgi:DNA-binding HxlR family transcriptional regulator